jgi:hypothetical protein
MQIDNFIAEVSAGESKSTENHKVPVSVKSYFDIDSSPFCVGNVNRAAGEVRTRLEISLLRAQLASTELAVVELFSLLAENMPEVLPTPWALVYDMLAAEERFWVYPQMTVADIEEGTFDSFTPYLNRQKLASEWRCLLDHTQKVLEAQESGKRHSLTA